MNKLRYTPPRVDFSYYACCDMLASSGFDDNNNTELIDYDYGGLV